MKLLSSLTAVVLMCCLSAAGSVLAKGEKGTFRLSATPRTLSVEMPFSFSQVSDIGKKYNASCKVNKATKTELKVDPVTFTIEGSTPISVKAVDTPASFEGVVVNVDRKIIIKVSVKELGNFASVEGECSIREEI
jgi:hypothetical protein